MVKVKDMNQVAEVETEIKRMGFRTSSMEIIRKPMEREARQKQMMLGGLGAISPVCGSPGNYQHHDYVHI